MYRDDALQVAFAAHCHNIGCGPDEGVIPAAFFDKNCGTIYERKRSLNRNVLRNSLDEWKLS